MDTVERIYTVDYIHERNMHRITFHRTGEIREAVSIEDLLKSLMKDYGFYLRRIK